MFDLIFFNPVLFMVFFPWVIAQTLKFIIGAIRGRVDFYNFITTGGMPSGHSTAVSALAMSTGLISGFDSPLFAATVLLATIVMHDAVVIRGAAGKQAQVINKIMDESLNKIKQKEFQYHHLKVRLGHKPIEVAAGAFLGIFSSLLIWNFINVWAV